MEKNKILFSIFILIFICNARLICQNDIKTENQNDENSDSYSDNFISDINYYGIDFEFGYKGDFFSNLSGGTDKSSVYLDNFDVIFNLNLEKMIGWKGATLITYILGNNGGEPAEYSGVIQGISNIAAHDTWKLYELRLEQILLDGDLSLLAGLYDLNSEFDTREFSGIFINPSHGIGPEFAMTGHNGPSIFPNTSLALRASYNFSPSWNLKAAVFDGIPGDLNNPHGTNVILDKKDGLLLTSEINFTNGSEEINGEYFKLAIGAWYYSGEFETISEVDNLGNPLLQIGNYGFYSSAEKFLFTENESTNEGLGAFVRFGWANNNINPVDSYIGAGINYLGLIPGREEDVLGIAIAAAHNNEKCQTILNEENIDLKDYEFILELTYSLKINNWLQIQPDVQYVANPAVCQQNTYAFVYGTRLQLSL
ncbi:MAG: carbohydrate porin [Bacteroidetes bacterium]|nr:carbohydrate porin [Bacteroidota bacterium]